MITNLKRYRVYLKSDTGKHKVTTTATSEESAIQKVMNAYSCPRSAIYKIKCDNKPVNIFRHILSDLME